MTIEEFHYDFKKKFNKLDSQKNRNLLVPEIDWALNEAMDIFIKIVAEPRYANGLGFESSQATIEDIRSLVKTAPILPTANVIPIPADYRYYVRSRVKISKGMCKDQPAKVIIQQHDDEFEEDSFTKSSFEWREVNGVFDGQGLRLFTDDTFTLGYVDLTYIRKPAYMHNAKDFPGGQYKLPSGVVLAGKQDCELPDHTHRTLVDIAVMLTAGEIQTSDFPIKREKLIFNQIV